MDCGATAGRVDAHRDADDARRDVSQGRPRQGRHRQVPRGTCPACRRKAATASSSSARFILHRMPPAIRTVCLEFFGQVRDSTPAIVEIKRLSRCANAIGASVARAARGARAPRRALREGGRLRDEGRSATAGRRWCCSATSSARPTTPSRARRPRSIRIANARGAEGFVAVSAESAQEVLARPLAHRRDRAAHQRVQDQRGRRHPARRGSATTPTASSGSTSSCRSRNKLRARRSARRVLRGARRVTHLWGPTTRSRPAPELVDAQVDEARALVAAVAHALAGSSRQPRRDVSALQDHSSRRVVEDRAARRRSRRSSTGRAFAPVMTHVVRAMHARVLRSRVFVALHMHAGDGNVHTNLPVNSDDYAMLQEANAAVARIMALARALDGVVSGEHGIGITKLEYLTDERAGAVRRLQAARRSARPLQPRQARARRARCPPTCRDAYTPSFSLIGAREPDPRAEPRSAASPTRSRIACAAASASRSARRTRRAPTCSTVAAQQDPRDVAADRGVPVRGADAARHRHCAHFDEFGDVADHCTVCHKCAEPMPGRHRLRRRVDRDAQPAAHARQAASSILARRARCCS